MPTLPLEELERPAALGALEESPLIPGEAGACTHRARALTRSEVPRPVRLPASCFTTRGEARASLCAWVAERGAAGKDRSGELAAWAARGVSLGIGIGVGVGVDCGIDLCSLCSKCARSYIRAGQARRAPSLTGTKKRRRIPIFP